MQLHFAELATFLVRIAVTRTWTVPLLVVLFARINDTSSELYGPTLWTLVVSNLHIVNFVPLTYGKITYAYFTYVIGKNNLRTVGTVERCRMVRGPFLRLWFHVYFTLHCTVLKLLTSHLARIRASNKLPVVSSRLNGLIALNVA